MKNRCNFLGGSFKIPLKKIVKLIHASFTSFAISLMDGWEVRIYPFCCQFVSCPFGCWLYLNKLHLKIKSTNKSYKMNFGRHPLYPKETPSVINFWSPDQIMREGWKSLVLEDPITAPSMRCKIQRRKVTCHKKAKVHQSKKAKASLFQKRRLRSEKCFVSNKRTFVFIVGTNCRNSGTVIELFFL